MTNEIDPESRTMVDTPFRNALGGVDSLMAKQTQIEKFKQAARELEADDSEKRFNERLGKIAKPKPKAATPRSKAVKN